MTEQGNRIRNIASIHNNNNNNIKLKCILSLTYLNDFDLNFFFFFFNYFSFSFFCGLEYTKMPSILTCTNTIQLSEFVAHLVPKIWTGTPFMTTDRLNLFRTFCQNIIKATQISSSCILVALFYIYRLRFAYPSIRGSMGSEVRLFTTALILANKFLDDNTFTNKVGLPSCGILCVLRTNRLS